VDLLQPVAGGVQQLPIMGQRIGARTTVAQVHAAQKRFGLIQGIHDAQCGIGVHRRPHILCVAREGRRAVFRCVDLRRRNSPSGRGYLVARTGKMVAF